MNETLCKYTIHPTEQRLKRARPIDLVVAGSNELPADKNLEMFGQHIAEIVAVTARLAAQNGHKLVLDAATGSSPKAVWPALSHMVSEGRANLSNLIIIGHEDAWGPKPGSGTDFDFQRRQMLESLGRTVDPITDLAHVTGEKIYGNFVPMHFCPVTRDQYPDGDRGQVMYEWAEEEAAAESAQQYTEIVRALLARDDVESLGVYGIGTDGHIGEWQISDMGFRTAVTKMGAFVQPQEHYSVEAGQFPIGGKQNWYWTRGMRRGEVLGTGRAGWQTSMGSQEVVYGLGLREMLKLDHVIFAFNDDSKADAFALVMEGSVSGKLREDGNDIAILERDKGKGERVWQDLASVGRLLERSKRLKSGTVSRINNSLDAKGQPERFKCGLLYREIYDMLDREEAPAEDPLYKVMGELTLGYVGRRSPVGQFIRFRELLGRQNTVVAPPEVVRGTAYESLAA